MGYMMPCNTLNEPGAPIGEYTKDEFRMDGYARLTETYLQRSGLRVMTVWDDASPMQRKSYEKHCRNLYGATVQNFKDVPSVRAARRATGSVLTSWSFRMRDPTSTSAAPWCGKSNAGMARLRCSLPIKRTSGAN